MRNALIVGVLAGSLAAATPAWGQVSVRAPFVAVDVGGGGVQVRAPFVNLFIPPARPLCVGPVNPYVGPPVLGPGVQPFVAPPPQQVTPPPPAPAVTAPRAPTIEEFGRTFQPKAGAYDVTLLNPLTGVPTAVRFTLPEGSPERVFVNRRNLEFSYGPGHFVRIHFDRVGAEVITR